jgi:hypothetical protein
MKSAITKLTIVAFTFLLSVNVSAQEFQGQAYYFSKTNMDMSRWNREGQMS